MALQHLQQVAELGPLLERAGVRHVIISPGSRNAPLIQLFNADKRFTCHSIVDERSAGYLALGMARETGRPVVVLTTSGTAVLNLSPAVAEAFQQRIPMVVVTADRPREILSQFNNQVTDQRAPFYNYSKGFFEFPAEVRSEEELQKGMEAVRVLVGEAMQIPAGPVHLNLPLTEPLYEALPSPMLSPDIPGTYRVRDPESLTVPDLDGKRILILAGMGNMDESLKSTLEELVFSQQATVVAENISNLTSDNFISTSELVLAGTSDEERLALRPDHVLAFGKQVVSKRMKLFVQSLVDVARTEIPEGEDLYALFKTLAGPQETMNHYLQAWKDIEVREQLHAAAYLAEAPFGSLSALKRILDAAPEGTVVHLGNSSTIRHSQLLPSRPDLTYYSNRGISGIDGSLSAAVGAAMVSNDEHLLILGDLSFVYDSNALWNKDFPGNLKIVVMNDGGGGIFRLLDGPDRMDFFEEFSVTHHPVSLELLSGAFGQSFRRAGDYEELESHLALLFKPGTGLTVLEVDCTGSDNRQIFKELFSK